ncbi:NADPH-dependent F420 reductase [Cognatiyoonia sp. IB215182]|uniref:NADPH-dependent F420 reductase n=1 Tax=Cognatiyoonia sp. IB215182 TaxID=3097353 RepID=UPI002A159286|nr:NAD(P)-binding domain-containing protein [Cognatiyoonia sp. IB215182]MDX8355724.1 NAD(P)-binding domain-containing protein [Cognatiyoonia sp. IB215182]
MKYAVLGTGMVGHTLATKLVALGHEVRMGARISDNPKAVAWAKANGPQSGHGTFADVAIWADRVIFAVNGANVVEVADAVTDGVVAGKTVIDVTNPLDMSNGMPPTLVPELSNTTSAGEALQARLPSAKVVKALNTMNHQIMVEPARVGGEHDVFLAGDHEDAKADVVAMLTEFGWSDPVDLGPLSAARGTEGLMPFWLRMWGVVGNADFNYRIVRA